MTLLDKLKTQGSTLTDVDGNTPKKYSGTSNYVKDLKTSQLDLDGKKPLTALIPPLNKKSVVPI